MLETSPEEWENIVRFDRAIRVRKLKSSAFQITIASQMSNFCSKTTTLSNPGIDLDACILDFNGQNIATLGIIKYIILCRERSFYRLLAIRFSSFFFCAKVEHAVTTLRYYAK